MWKREHTVPVRATKATIWAALIDVEKWPKWNATITESALLGEFAVGTPGRKKQADGELVDFVVIDAVPDERLVTQVASFGSKISDMFDVIEDEAGLRITYCVQVQGMLSLVKRFSIGSALKKSVPLVVESFVKYVEALPPVVPAVPVIEHAPEQAAPAEQPAAAKAAPASTQAQPAATEPKAPVVSPVEPAKEVAPVAPQEQPAIAAASPEIVAETAAVPSEATAQEAAEEEPLPEAEPLVGDAAEDALRQKDVREQIAHAAQVPDPVLPEKPMPVEEVKQGDVEVGSTDVASVAASEEVAASTASVESAATTQSESSPATESK